MRALAVWLLLAGPAAAFDNDYAALFAAHEAEVMQAEPGVRRLELSGPVVVEERRLADGSLYYSGTDMSGLTTAGCGMGILIEIVIKTGSCPTMINEAEREILEAELLQVARFVAENAYPPVPENEVRPRLVALMRKAKSRLDRMGALYCDPEDSGQQDAVEIARHLARPSGQAVVARMISRPRLPVKNVCL